MPQRSRRAQSSRRHDLVASASNVGKDSASWSGHKVRERECAAGNARRRDLEPNGEGKKVGSNETTAKSAPKVTG